MPRVRDLNAPKNATNEINPTKRLGVPGEPQPLAWEGPREGVELPPWFT